MAYMEMYLNKMTKKYNYFGTEKAIKLLYSMNEEDKVRVLSDKEVQQAILSIDDTNILRKIFRKCPAFFQEIMFSDQSVQDLLITPKKNLSRKELIENYNKRDYSFSDESLRQLEVFLHTIKSQKIYDELIESKFFQMILTLCYDKQMKRSFFKNIDVVKLFYNIVNDDEVFNTRVHRKRNVLKMFNNVSDHILLCEDYKKIISDPVNFISEKRWSTRKFEKVYITKETLSMFSLPMINELLEFKNIDIEFIKDFFRSDFVKKIHENNYNFNLIFPDLLEGTYNCFSKIVYIYFEIVRDNIDRDEVLKNKFIDFLYNTLCNGNNFDSQDEEIIKNVLYKRVLSNSISKSDYQKLFGSHNSLKTIFYLKFGKTSYRMDYLTGITVKQIMYLNVKHINQILKSIKLENEDELSNTYSLAIKLYLTFGLERTLRILNNNYGCLNRTFFDNISALNVENVILVKEGSKYIPSVLEGFIDFMFANEKSNHFIDMLKEPNCLLNKHWSYLYNNFSELREKCHNVITLKKLNIVFKQLSPSRDIDEVTPDNYRLNQDDILNDVFLGNKTRKSNGVIYKDLLDIYNKMKQRIESSIPYISGTSSNGYSYEMMKLNDPIVFTLGYKGNCCIRVDDIAHNHLLHATLCRNGRILLIYDENHNIAGFSPLKRNGEVLIANSIECLHKIKNDDAIIAFSDAINDLVALSQSNEEEPIRLVCIGEEAYAKPMGTQFPGNIKVPTIYEKDDSIYASTDIYHKRLIIIYKHPNIDLKNIKYGDPKISYLDPRNKVASCDFTTSSREDIDNALNVINAVRYTNTDIEEQESFVSCDFYKVKYCIYNDDWYLIMGSDDQIYGEYISVDPRAKSEFETAYNEFISNNSINNIEGIKKLILKR